jgi:hypothetical protein
MKELRPWGTMSSLKSYLSISIILAGTKTAPEKGGPLKNFDPVNKITAFAFRKSFNMLFSNLP